MRLVLASAVACLALTTAAFAQAPKSDPQLNFCQKAVTAVQAQRNNAQDNAAQCNVQLELVNEEFKALQAKVAAEKKPESPALPPPSSPSAGATSGAPAGPYGFIEGQ